MVRFAVMMPGMESPIVTSDADRDILRATALVYRARRQAGDRDYSAFRFALAFYLERHPEAARGDAATVVGRIASASWCPGRLPLRR